MFDSFAANHPPYGLTAWTLARFSAPYGFCPAGDVPTAFEPIKTHPLSCFVSSQQAGHNEGVTHVALMDTRPLMDLSLAKRVLARLPVATQRRLSRITHAARSAESLGGRLIATCFAQILGQTLREEPPYAPLFETSDLLRAYDVSLAHSHGLAAFALAALTPASSRPHVALDVERVRPRQNIREIVTHSLGEAFWERLATFASPEDPHATLLAFYRLWGEYECAIKLSRFSPLPYRVREATNPEHGFTISDPTGNPWASQAFLLAAPMRDTPQTPFVLTLAQHTPQPVRLYHLTLNDALAYVG